MWSGDTFGGYWVIVALWLSGFFILYFVILHGSYLLFMIQGLIGLTRYKHLIQVNQYYSLFNSTLLKPVSILVPAHNEQRNIAETVLSLLLLHYPQYEVVVIDDGSTDETVKILTERFKLEPRDRVYRSRLKSKPVTAIYESKLHPNLVVVSKENGGKSDALNCGINVCSYPYFCTIDADTVLQEDALLKMIRPFVDDPQDMVAVGGVVRVANNCVVEKGRVISIRIPRTIVELVQVVEYLQSFLSSRVAFSSFNAILLISGAFGMFKKDTVIEVGGYRSDTIGEDMELVVRLQRVLRFNRRPCRMVFLPDPVCWTEVPSDWGSLSRQRRRWQKGLIDSIRYNSDMLFNPRYGRLGLLAMPYYLIFELLGPIIELFGYATMILFFVAGVLSPYWTGLFLLLSVGFGMLLSIGGILLEELSLHRFPRPQQIAALLLGCIVYNFGFRQLNAIWRFSATFEYLGGYRLWGRIRRLGFRSEAGVQARPV